MESKPWLKNYDDGIPHTLQPYPERTLLDVVTETARQRPDHPALLFVGTRLSYAELERWSDVFAAALVAHGVEKGDRVAVLLPNCPQAVIGQLGAWKAGAIAVMLNPLYTERELQHALADCGAETALVLTRFYDKLKALQARTSLRTVIATNIKEYMPAHLRFLFTLLRERREGDRISLQTDDLWLSKLLHHHRDEPRPNVSVGPHDAALILFSGGTTGTPKGVVSTHQGPLMAAMQIQAWTESIMEQWDDVIMLNMPLFHVYGNVGVLSFGLLDHHPLVLVPNPADMDAMFAAIRRERPAFLPGVPTLLIRMLNHPDLQAGKVDLTSIKLCISGAAPLLAETKRRFEDLTGGRIVEGYALTESVMAAVITPIQGGCPPGAIGLPLPDVVIRIVDADTGQDTLPLGEIGEVLISAPELMQGYWQRPSETASTIRQDPSLGSEERWLYTGDLGYLDEGGYLYIVDRKKDVIKPSGFQVWPREVEEVISTHPAVAEVGVAGVPDDYQGEAVKAWVVLREGQQLTADELRAYCRENLAAYKVPRAVEFRDSLPKTQIGKVLRRELA